MPDLWLRREAAANELRTPIVPRDAGALVAAGMRVVVEESSQRAFPISEYVAAGCLVAPAGSWRDAPPDSFVIGLKEPAPYARELRHRHILFGHAYKGQAGAEPLLRRFVAGGGLLLDLETLTDEAGRRAAAFGFWAGYVGAALAVLRHRDRLTRPLRPMTRPELDTLLGAARDDVRAVVVGALGRSGSGACAALEKAGVPVTRWDVDETRYLDREALLGHDILVNCVFTTEPGPPFLTFADLDRHDRRLAVVSDVTCDFTSACNRLPVNEKATDWERPVRRLRTWPRPLDVLAIDNLPSLLPREASTAFSADLLPYLTSLPDGGPAWDRCHSRFQRACEQLTNEG